MYFAITPTQPATAPFPCKETVWFRKYIKPESVRDPLPANELTVFGGVTAPELSSEVVGVALGSWTNNRHEPVQVVPQFVPGAQRLMVPLLMATRA